MESRMIDGQGKVAMWKTDCHDSRLEDWFDLEVGVGEVSEVHGGRVIDHHFKA